MACAAAWRSRLVCTMPLPNHFLQMRERDRAGDGAGERRRRHQRAHPAILGDHVDAAGDRLCRAAALPGTAVEPHFAAGEILEAVETAQQPALAGAERAGDGDDLAQPDVEIERRCLRDQPARPSATARPLRRMLCRRPATLPRASGRSSRRPPPGNRSAAQIRRPPGRRAARRRGRRCAAGRPAGARCRGWRCRMRAAARKCRTAARPRRPTASRSARRGSAPTISPRPRGQSRSAGARPGAIP